MIDNKIKKILSKNRHIDCATYIYNIKYCTKIKILKEIREIKKRGRLLAQKD